MPDARRNLGYVGSLIFLLALLLPIFLIKRADTGWLLSSYFVAFGCYLHLWKHPNATFVFGLGLTARVGLFATLPILSDDVFRFLWDGFLLKNGIHPFAEIPRFYLDSSVPGLTPELFEMLNSKERFTVYPPLNQGLFWLSVTISDNWLVATGFMRLLLLTVDIGTFVFLKKILVMKGKDPQLAFLYFLNPLVILEGVGNLHFEVLVIFFLTAGLYYFYKNETWKAATAIGLAVGTKLLPLIFLPYFFFQEITNRRITFTLLAGAVSVLTLLPLFSESFIIGMKDSLGLYFQNFEFNPSLFYLAKQIGYALTGTNQIAVVGPILSVLSMISILLISIAGILRKWPVEKVLLFVLTAYLLLSTTVHPWYILPLIMLGLLSGYVYPLVWSLVIFITYAGYATTQYELSMWWVALEYFIVVLAFIFNKSIKQWLTTSSSSL